MQFSEKNQKPFNYFTSTKDYFTGKISANFIVNILFLIFFLSIQIIIPTQTILLILHYNMIHNFGRPIICLNIVNPFDKS